MRIHTAPLLERLVPALAGLLFCLVPALSRAQAPVILQNPLQAGASSRYPVFSWQPTAGPSVTYRLRIVERLQGQSATAALLSNPTWFEADGLTAPLFVYPLTAPALQPSRDYVWQVVAVARRGGIESALTDVYHSEPSVLTTPQVKLPPARRKREKREERNPPAVYAHLHDAPPAVVHYVSGESLGIRHEKRHGVAPVEELSVSVEDLTQPLGDAQWSRLRALSMGDNKFSVPVELLVPGRVYRLTARTPDGRRFYLNFVRREAEGNAGERRGG